MKTILAEMTSQAMGDAGAWAIGLFFGLLILRGLLRSMLPGLIDPVRETLNNSGCMLFFVGLALFIGIGASSSSFTAGLALALMGLGFMRSERREG